MCGIVGVISGDGKPVLRDLANGAHFLQHRGQAYAGLLTFDPEHRSCTLEKGEGLADNIFKPLVHIGGDLGLSHTRYKTHGQGGIENAQPFFDAFAGLALAHNGHITNVKQIEEELAARGQALNTDCDAGALLRVLALWFEHFRRQDPAGPEQEAMFRAIEQVQERVTGAFSVVAATPAGLYAFRDPHGFRPMVRGRRTRPGSPSLMIASETLALEQNGYQVEQHVANGAAMFIDRSLEPDERSLVRREQMPCAFELIYFADVESSMLGDKIRSFRWRAGRALALYLMATHLDLIREIDLVVPIPHSPIPGAEAFAQKCEKELDQCALQYAQPVSKYRYGGRVFMAETQEDRELAAMLDFRVDARAVAGKNIFVLDDSIVRGTNAKRIVRALRAEGANKVFFGTLWPMVVDSCFLGINTPTQEELIGARCGCDPDRVQQALGVDALYYLPEAQFREKVLKQASACMACVTNQRPVGFRYDGTVLPPQA
jgi:amidophosphoribosyltransferase